MPSPKKFDQAAVQKALQDANIDGWLFYDFRGSDPIAADILGLNPTKKGTRRWFYYVPANGQPTKLLHAIEKRALEILPGEDRVYLTWESLRDHLREILSGAKTVAMQYSPGNEVPYVSKVDAGTVESVRAAGVEVVTSADLVQLFNAVLTDEQFDGHQRTAELLYSLIEDVFGWVGAAIRSGNPLTERQVVDPRH